MINDGLTHVQDSSHEKKHSMVMRATNSTIERKQSHVVLRAVQQKMAQLFEASKSHKRWPVRRDGLEHVQTRGGTPRLLRMTRHRTEGVRTSSLKVHSEP